MRIRKRQVPLPFSSISPVPLSSDPIFNRPPVAVVQLPLRQQQPPPSPCFHPHDPSESDHPNHPIRQPLPTQAFASSSFHGQQLMKTKQDYLVLKPGGGGGREEKNSDTGKGEGLGRGVLSHSGSSHPQAVGDIDGDDDGDMLIAKDAYNKSDAGKMKTKVNKKLVQQPSNDEEASKDDGSGGSAKKRGRGGGALVEGSRCSRVNGRGWRCCQQTLVGYSLCEHHLGKGRLRSITSVRDRAKEERLAKYADHRAPVPSNSSQQLVKQTKKRAVKLGMVKARSMSSLLGQIDNAIAVADDNNQ
ncbi:uncharacterized protein LOC120143064 [Hibiscus syriacus]|uniref:uncharacterized protein LOC120143064 n=1 Tax=Hibiscus syriacus TaxID=106335 RepID=UPI0019237D73|nr:uncharacterized protein LOC120143064 [Hibiscus syriacus]